MAYSLSFFHKQKTEILLQYTDLRVLAYLRIQTPRIDYQRIFKKSIAIFMKKRTYKLKKIDRKSYRKNADDLRPNRFSKFRPTL